MKMRMEIDSGEVSAPNYFQSYEDLEVHHLMLKDTARNEAYRKAILGNADSFRGKTVLDVGAGTGILSVFCAQAGASKVYAVEASNLFEIAGEVVKENKMEHVIEVIHSEVEKISLPTKVDIIVSEWMGFYLFHEGMLESVIVARDKFLKIDGLMFPCTATLYCAPCSVPSMHEFWNDISGVSMSCVGKHMRQLKSIKPEITQISPEDILAEPESIAWFDLNEVSVEDLQTLYSSQVVAALKAGQYQGIALWFTCEFPTPAGDGGDGDGEAVVLSTHPKDTPTHWKQTVVVLPTDFAVEEGSPIAYEICLQKVADDSRKYTIEVTMQDPDEVEHPEGCKCHMTKCILTRAVIERYERGEEVAESS